MHDECSDRYEGMNVRTQYGVMDSTSRALEGSGSIPDIAMICAVAEKSRRYEDVQVGWS